MTPHTTGGIRGGNLEIDRIVRGVGRIRQSIYSTDPRKLARVNAIIDKLIERDEIEILKAFQRRDVTAAELVDADRNDNTRLSLSRLKLSVYLWDRIVTIEDGSEKVEAGAISKALAKVRGLSTRKRYIDSFKALQQKASAELGADARVLDLLEVDWEKLYANWKASNSDWMHLKRALSRFATLHLNDKWDPFARQLRQLVPSKKVKKRRPNITIEQFTQVVEAAPAHAAASFWVLAITGVRVGEYLRSTKEHLNPVTRTYDVPGTKTEGSAAPVRVDERWWIYLERGVPSRLKYKWLRIYWTRACVAAGIAQFVGTGEFRNMKRKRAAHRPRAGEKPQIDRIEITRYQGPTIHDIRHCHAQWAIDAGVAESKVQASLRHENPGQTRDYTMRAGTLDVSSALADRILTPPAEPTPLLSRKRKA